MASSPSYATPGTPPLSGCTVWLGGAMGRPPAHTNARDALPREVIEDGAYVITRERAQPHRPGVVELLPETRCEASLLEESLRALGIRVAGRAVVREVEP